MSEVTTCSGSFDSPFGLSIAEENVLGQENFAVVELVSLPAPASGLLKETSVPLMQDTHQNQAVNLLSMFFLIKICKRLWDHKRQGAVYLNCDYALVRKKAGDFSPTN